MCVIKDIYVCIWPPKMSDVYFVFVSEHCPRQRNVNKEISQIKHFFVYIYTKGISIISSGWHILAVLTEEGWSPLANA